MKLSLILLAALSLLAFITLGLSAPAQIPGGCDTSPQASPQASPSPLPDIIYPVAAPGEVSFSHQTHQVRAGLGCDRCHPQPFAKEAQRSGMKMVDVDRGFYCGVCHNGKTAFGPNDCRRCHRESPPPG